MNEAYAIAVLGTPDDVVTRDSNTLRLRKEILPVDQLSEKLATFVGALEKTLDRLKEVGGTYELDEVTVSVEISTTGNVSLLGSGVSATGTGGLELTFKRRSATTNS